MNLESFKASLAQKHPPDDFNLILKGLWYDAKGDWHNAHEIAQSNEGHTDFDRLHAYLHRKEGDNWNANYWYRICNEKMPTIPLEAELEELIKRY